MVVMGATVVHTCRSGNPSSHVDEESIGVEAFT